MKGSKTQHLQPSSDPRSARWSWTLLGLWIVTILALIPFANELWSGLSTIGNGLPLRFGIVVLVLGALGVVVVRFRRRPAGLAWTLLLAVGLLIAMMRLDAPAERIHLVQYFVLGVLAFSCFALRFDDLRIYLASLLLALLVGALDELVQWLTPGRYWDLRDVGFNLVGALVSQAWIVLALRPPSVTGKGISVRLLAEHRWWWIATLAAIAGLVLVPMWLA